MTRRGLFAALAGLFCVRAKAEPLAVKTNRDVVFKFKVQRPDEYVAALAKLEASIAGYHARMAAKEAELKAEIERLRKGRGEA